MAPVLFLLLMSAAAKTLKSAWKQGGIEVLTVAHTPDNELNIGFVQGHTPRMYTSCKLTTYEIYQLLYVDDGIFLFPTRAALIKRLALMHSHLARFGLKVHIGQNSNPSKAKCVFFPLPQFFDDDHNSAPVLTDGVNEPWLIYQDPSSNPDTPHNTTTTLCCSKQEKQESESARTAREDAKYDALPEINIADGYITFCRKFKYLGSQISYNL
jgi:hypothetical protein